MTAEDTVEPPRPPLRRRGSNIFVFGTGAAEQALLAGSALLFGLVLANAMPPDAFGIYTVAWSLLVLVEAVLIGFFGDGVPAIAQRLRRSRWPELRGVIFAGSLAISLMLAGLVVIGAIVVQAAGGAFSAQVPLLLACALALVGFRLQQAFRRICYLSEDRVLALAGAFAFCVVLLASTAATVLAGNLTPATAIACWALALLVSTTPMLLKPGYITMPRSRMLRWYGVHVRRTSGWYVASSVLQWGVAFGILPAVAMLQGLEAAGGLRVLQILVAPLQMAGVVSHTVLLPRFAAAASRSKSTRPTFTSAVLRVLAGLLILSAAYCLPLLLVSGWLLPTVFPHQAALITTVTVALILLSAALDTTRVGLSLPFLAIGQGRPVAGSWLVAAIILALALPLTTLGGGLAAIALALVASQAAAVLVLAGWLALPGRTAGTEA
jgi:O-antigen/teichoic acid export membrane protein